MEQHLRPSLSKQEAEAEAIRRAQPAVVLQLQLSPLSPDQVQVHRTPAVQPPLVQPLQ
jgi:hypothetical protein